MLSAATLPGAIGTIAKRLPPFPKVVLQLLAMLRDEAASLESMTRLARNDALLTSRGIRTDPVDYLVARNPYKHGRFTPGTHIPIPPVERLAETRPAVILILPWNLRREIAQQLAPTRAWGARLVVPIPRVEVVTS